MAHKPGDLHNHLVFKLDLEVVSYCTAFSTTTAATSNDGDDQAASPNERSADGKRAGPLEADSAYGCTTAPTTRVNVNRRTPNIPSQPRFTASVCDSPLHRKSRSGRPSHRRSSPNAGLAPRDARNAQAPPLIGLTRSFGPSIRAVGQRLTSPTLTRPSPVFMAPAGPERQGERKKMNY